MGKPTKDTPSNRQSNDSSKSGVDAQGQKKKPKETKEDKFKRLAKKRVEKATKAIQSIGTLANRYNYDYEDDDAKRILRHLQRELDEVQQKFNIASSRKQRSEFKWMN